MGRGIKCGVYHSIWVGWGIHNSYIEGEMWIASPVGFWGRNVPGRGKEEEEEKKRKNVPGSLKGHELWGGLTFHSWLSFPDIIWLSQGRSGNEGGSNVMSQRYQEPVVWRITKMRTFLFFFFFFWVTSEVTGPFLAKESHNLTFVVY